MAQYPKKEMKSIFLKYESIVNPIVKLKIKLKSTVNKENFPNSSF